MQRYLVITLALLATTTAVAQQRFGKPTIESPYLYDNWGAVPKEDPYQKRWAKVWDFIPPPPPACQKACAYYPGVDMNPQNNEGSLLQIEQQIRDGKLRRWYGSD